MNKDSIRLGLKTLKVKCFDRYVGTLAMTPDGKVAFSYDDEWLVNGFAISPFSLPLEKKVFIPGKRYFNGLFGIFADSLPDAWGQLLLDRILKEYKITEDITVLDRLALVGTSGMGALEYEPDYRIIENEEIDDLDYLSKQCQKVLKTEYSPDLDILYKLGGSSGGARPKILTHIEDKDWIIKFLAGIDGPNCGLREYIYLECARKCGIKMTETRLFPSKICDGYFGTVRFDRIPYEGKMKKVHMATAAAILEADFMSPCLDYSVLMKLTHVLTRGNAEDMENMFRRACFNVFAHNRDDHAKNFTFLYNEDEDCWRLSPAYDITYSNTYYGEHTTSVDGNGKNPGEKELMNVGTGAGIKKSLCEDIIDEIRTIVGEELAFIKKDN